MIAYVNVYCTDVMIVAKVLCTDVMIVVNAYCTDAMIVVSEVHLCDDREDCVTLLVHRL
jgi:hypothetical protein